MTLDRSLADLRLSREELAQVDAICERFERALRAGEQPRIEDYVQGEQGAVADGALLELRKLQSEYCEKREKSSHGDRPPSDKRETVSKVEGAGDTSRLLDRRVPLQDAHVGEADFSPVRVLGDYALLEELGRGGMGVVYKATDRKLKRTVAVKTILGGLHVDGELLTRFRAEAEAVARVQHPGVVQIYEIGEADGQLFLVLEYVDGRPLHEFTQSEPQAESFAAAFIHALSQAVEHAHTQGVVHRDLKPANVLVAERHGGSLAGRGRSAYAGNSALVSSVRYTPDDGAPSQQPLAVAPKITDFGLAKDLQAEQQLTRTGSLLGTPAYMAPEQAGGNNRDVGPATDVYALGAILYWMLTGRPPFQGPTAVETVLMVRENDPVAPRHLRPALSRDLETICLTCLEKDPDKRYQSAQALADELERFLNHEPIVARPIGPIGRTHRWCRRNPVVALLGLLVVLSLLAGISVAGWKWRDAVLTNRELVAERQAVRNERDASLLREAELNFRKGFDMASAGAVSEGLLRMADSLKMAPAETEEGMPSAQAERIAAFRRVARTNLAAWSRRAPAKLWARSDGKTFYHNRGAYSSDGKWLYLGSVDGRLQRIDVKSGAVVDTPFQFDNSVDSIAFSDDETQLLILTQRERQTWWAHVVDLDDGGTAATFGPFDDQRRQINAGRFGDSPDKLIFLEHKAARRWDVVRQEWTKVVQFSSNFHVAQGGQLFVAQGQLWNARTLKRIDPGLSLNEGDLIVDVHEGRSAVLVKSPATRRGRAHIRRVDLRGGHSDGEVHCSDSWHVRFAPDGRHCTTNLETDGNVLEVSTGRPLARITPYQHGFRVHPLGREVLASESDAKWRIRLPRAISRPMELARGLVSAGAADVNIWTKFRDTVVYDLERKFAVTKSLNVDNLLRFWDVSSGQPKGPPLRFAYDVNRVAVSPDGRQLAVGGTLHGQVVGFVSMWDIESATRIWGPVTITNSAARVAFSPDGRTLASGDYHGLVRLWDTATGRELCSPLTNPDPDHREIVWAFDFTRDGKKLAVGTTRDFHKNPHVMLWDLETKLPLLGPLPHDDSVNWVRFTPDGDKLLAKAQKHGKLRVWDAHCGELLHELPLDHGVITLGPQGRRFAVALARGEVRLYDVETCELVGEPIHHQSEVRDLAFNSDGGLLVTGTEGGNARLWDTETTKPLGPPVAQALPIYRVAFLPGGKQYVSTASDGSTRRWAVPQPVQGKLDDVVLRLQVLTGRELEQGAVSILRPEAWQDRCRHLLHSNDQEPAVHQDGREYRLGLEPNGVDWLEARARDAEQDRDWWAARRFLDQLLQRMPNNGQLELRRARTYSAHENFEAAHQAYARAEQLLDASAGTCTLHDWYQHRVVDTMKHDRRATAAWYLSRLVAADPDNAYWRELRDQLKDEAKDD